MPLKYNSTTGNLRGHVFDSNDLDTLPSFMRGYPKDRLIKEAAELNERYKIVSYCDNCHNPLIAEEYLAHKMNHLPSRSRALVRTVMAASKEVQQEVLDALQSLRGDKLNG